MDEKRPSIDHTTATNSSMSTDANVNSHTILKQKLVVENVDLLQASQNVNVWGSGYLRLYLCLALLSLASTMNGYDASLMSSINAVPSFTRFFNLPASGATATGIVFAIYNIGQMIGALFVWTADWQGRRLPIFLGSLGVCIATIVMATTPSLGGFIAGRFLLAFFASLVVTSTPMLMLELAPPQHRAICSGIYNTLYYLGSIIASCTVYGTFNNASLQNRLLEWRIPIWVQLICPGLVFFGVYLCPESPRWLVGKGRETEARAILARFHANGDASHGLIALQMNEIKQSLAEQPMMKWWTMFDLRDMVKTRNRRWRLMLNVAFSWFGQFSGNNVVSYYLPDLVNRVGITSTSTQLLINIIYAIIGWIFATFGAYLHDHVGRRKMFMTALCGMIISLAITAGTASSYLNTGNLEASRASIAFIFIFGAVFAVGFTAMQPVYPGEVMTNDMRAKGMAIYQLTSGTAGFVNIFAAPVALQNIQYWFYIFFVFWDMFEVGFIYLFFVETKGRTLEELDEVFDAPNPRKASTKKVVAQARIVKDEMGVRSLKFDAP